MTPQDGWKQEADDLDAVLRLIGLDPQACRTDGGSLNIGRVRAAVEASARKLAAPERTEQAAPNRCPTGDLESAAVEMYERHGGKDWMREPDTETWRAVANIGFKWAALSHPRRHPLDVEALHELQKVMADFGGDWPDVPGEQEVVRRAKMLSRLWKTDAAGNWQQYAKEGETAQDVIERERKDSDALCTLLARAREKQQAAPGFVMVPVEVVKFLTGEGPLDGLWFGEHPFGLGGGKYWWRNHLPAARPLTASPTAPSAEASEPVRDEPKSLNAKIADQLRPFLKPGDKVIWREAFRWHDDNGVLSNHYDSMSVSNLADDFGYEFDWDLNMNHAAIVRASKGTPL